MAKGKIFMGVNILGTEDFHHSIPQDVLSKLSESRFFVVENIKNARRYLRKIDKTFPIDDSTFLEIGKHAEVHKLWPLLKKELNAGQDLVVLSDAGCSGVADPGATVAAWAQDEGFHVHPMVGPSSILLALMASGFNGQQFRFNGYLPRDRKERQRALKEFERIVKSTNETQIFMDTPFRNLHVLEDVFEVLEPNTRFCIAANLTHPDEYIKTVEVRDLESLSPKIEKQPAIFLIGK